MKIRPYDLLPRSRTKPQPSLAKLSHRTFPVTDFFFRLEECNGFPGLWSFLVVAATADDTNNTKVIRKYIRFIRKLVFSAATVGLGEISYILAYLTSLP